ncbi:MAG TPA: HD domain-containing phosphohydrolase, partial [Chloroflexota bacterium]|nr:HD domain-containing phosphohydrolase [Chloroflexota bacterium]
MSGPTPSAAGTVLLVDDDELLLAALTRLLRPDGLRVLTATNGHRALEILETEQGSVDVVVSDYAMPNMNGADLLRAVRLRWPDATRILATGNADLRAASRTVNEGQVARLITKPCDPDQFREAVSAGLTQSRLVLENRRLHAVAEEQAARLEQWTERLEKLVDQRTAELERANVSLQRGLLDTVRLLVGFLERRLPQRANRCREVARLAGRLGERVGVPTDVLRRIQVAALVHDIGLMGLPDPIVRQRPEDMPQAARLQYETHATIGQGMLSAVEELVEIATWIRHHHERWDGRGYPDHLAGPAIPLACRLIAIADGYLEAVARDGGTAARWRSAQRAAGAFDPQLVEVLAAEVEDALNQPITTHVLPLDRLQPGFRLAAPIMSANGAVLVSSDELVSVSMLRRIRGLASAGALASETV